MDQRKKSASQDSQEVPEVERVMGESTVAAVFPSHLDSSRAEETRKSGMPSPTSIFFLQETTDT